MKQCKIAVTGAGGFLGSRIVSYYASKKDEYLVLQYTRENLDITDKRKTEQVLDRDCPDILIHTAAVSDIGFCREHPEMSEKVNVEGVMNLADWCEKSGTRMIFCSSDQVYGGSAGIEPHKEDEEKLCPPTLYGRQKLRAEQYLSVKKMQSIILRLSWMYAKDFRPGKEHGNLLSSLIEAVENRKQIAFPVFDRRSLTDVWEVVRNLEQMFSADPGIYNFGSENDLSTYDVVEILMRKNGWLQYLQKNTEAFAAQPRNLRMDGKKWKKAGVSFLRTEEAFANIDL